MSDALRSDLLACTFVQAWECTSDGGFNGTVYTQAIAVDKIAEGCNVVSVTIVRHDDGRREYEKGTLAAHVRHFREEQARK